MTRDTHPRERLLRHLREHAVRTDGPFTLRSGEVSDWYVDARQTTFDGEGATAVGEAVLGAIDSRATAVGGLTMGADPISIATAIAAATRGRPLTAFSVRKDSKTHGTGGRIVGPVGTEDVAVVLEDTTTTGSAMVEAIGALGDAGVRVSQAIALVDRSGEAARLRIEALGIPYLALFTPRDLGVMP